jgi:hypothetical protein
MWGCDPLCFEDRFLKLEARWIQIRTERSILNLTGKDAALRLNQLDEEESRAFSAMSEYVTTRRSELQTSA